MAVRAPDFPDGLDWIKVGNVEMLSRAYVAAFGFKGPDQQKPAKVLSGGERRRRRPKQKRRISRRFRIRKGYSSFASRA